MPSFAPVKRQNLADQLANSLRDAILSGELKPGEALPSERNLAERFEVNRSSVREALHRLDAWGLVEIRQGESTRVRDVFASAGLHLLPYLIAPGGQLDPDMLRDMLELRAALLGWTGALAAARATPEQVERLQALTETLLSAASPEAREKADWDYFELIVEMSGNRILAMLSRAMRRVHAENRTLFAAFYLEGIFDPSHHPDATAAIARGDVACARDAMTAFGNSAPGATT